MALSDEPRIPDTPFDEDFPVDGVIRAAYIISHLDKVLHVLELAAYVHNGLPKEMRAILDVRGNMDSFNEEAVERMAYHMAEFPPAMIDTLKRMFHEVRAYVGVWVDDEDSEPKLFGMLDEQDMKVIQEMVAFVQHVGKKSVRQLLQFLQASNDGDWSYLLVRSKGSHSEIRMRYDVSENVLTAFDL